MLTENTLWAIKILSTISEQNLSEEELLKSTPIEERIAGKIIEKLKSGALLKISSSGDCFIAKPLANISVLDVISVIGEELHLSDRNKPLSFEGTPEAEIILSTIDTFICKQLAKVKIKDITIR